MADDWITPGTAAPHQADDWVVPEQQHDNRGAIDKLLGIGGPRYQTFPERIVRRIGEAFGSGMELTKEAEQGIQYFDPQSGKVLSPAEAKTPETVSAAALGVTAAPTAAEALGGAADIAAKSSAARKAAPSMEQIRDSAKAAYKAIKDARLTVTPSSVERFSAQLKTELDTKLISAVSAPRSFQAIGQLEKSNGNLADIMNVYSELGHIKPSEGTDFAAAMHIRDAINSYFKELPNAEVVSGDPQFTQALSEHARSSWRSYAELDQIETALRIGEHRAAVSGTGANTQNAMRQRIREIFDSDAKVRGYSPDAKAQLEKIVMGTWLSNQARYLGKFAPSGPVSAITTGMAAIGGDLAGGHGAATAMAALVAIPATIAKYLGTYLTRRQIAELESIIKNESPIGKASKSAIEAQPPGIGARALESGTPALMPGAAASALPPDGTASPLAQSHQSPFAP